MSSKSKTILPQWIQDGFVKMLEPLVNVFLKLNIHPNTFTIWGLIISVIGGFFFAIGELRLGGIFIIIGGICDIFDGKIARKSNKVTKFGALFDSSLDRYGEIFMFLGVAIFLERNQFFLTSIMIFIALGGSTMVSYVRARAEGLGYDCKVGIMQRPERIVLMGVSALIHAYALMAAVWIIAVLSNYTAFQRMQYVYLLEKKEKSNNKL